MPVALRNTTVIQAALPTPRTCAFVQTSAQHFEFGSTLKKNAQNGTVVLT